MLPWHCLISTRGSFSHAPFRISLVHRLTVGVLGPEHQAVAHNSGCEEWPAAGTPASGRSPWKVHRSSGLTESKVVKGSVRRLVAAENDVAMQVLISLGTVRRPLDADEGRELARLVVLVGRLDDVLPDFRHHLLVHELGDGFPRHDRAHDGDRRLDVGRRLSLLLSSLANGLLYRGLFGSCSLLMMPWYSACSVTPMKSSGLFSLTNSPVVESDRFPLGVEVGVVRRLRGRPCCSASFDQLVWTCRLPK